MGVAPQLLIVFAAIGSHQHVRVERGRRNHAKHLARGRFNGHNAANLAAHQSLAQLLQVSVDAERQRAPRFGHSVETTILIMSLDAAVNIAQHDFHALHAA